MFCKNCGREIDQKTLNILMRPGGEPVVCSKCRQPLENAEICGGFWGLIASGEEMAETGNNANQKTVMLDQNGRPVQMNRGSQSRKIPGATEADRVWARMILEGSPAPQNFRQTADPAYNADAAGALGTREQSMSSYRSESKKSTELWITRGAALFLGICLIISLFAGGIFSGRKGNGAADGSEGSLAAADQDTRLKETETGDQTGQDMQDPDPGDQEGLIKKEEDDQEDNSAGNPAENSEDNSAGNSEDHSKDASDENSAGDSDEKSEENSEGDSEGQDASDENTDSDNAIVNAKKTLDTVAGGDAAEDAETITGEYSQVIRAIRVGNQELNIESEATYTDGDGNELLSIKRSLADSEEPLSELSAIDGQTVTESCDPGQGSIVYEYENGCLKKKTIEKGDGTKESVSYLTDSDHPDQVTEKYDSPQQGLDPEGKSFQYRSVVKTYDSDRLRHLTKIEYFTDEDASEAVQGSYGTVRYQYSDPIYNAGTYETPDPDFPDKRGLYYIAESYSDSSESRITVEGADYKYDEIRYVYGYSDDGSKIRLIGMGYYKDGSAAEGPNGFSYLHCEYDDEANTRKDSFEDTDGGSVILLLEKCRDPFLSEAVFPGYYSEEFPYLVGRPSGSGGAE